MTGDHQDRVERGGAHRPAPSPTEAVIVTAAMTTLTALTVWGRLGSPMPTAVLGLDIAVGALSVGLSALLLWRPVHGALALAVLAALSPAATPSATFGGFQVAQRRGFRVAVMVAAAGVAGHAVQGLWRPTGGISYGWWLVLVAASYAALVGWGSWLQARRALLASLHDRARRAEAEQGRRVAEARMAERTRLAREMHDVLAHRLSLLATYAGALEYRPDAAPQQLSHAAGVIRSGVHQALQELREVIGLLRDDEHEGGQGRPQPTLADLPRLLADAQSAGTTIRLHDGVRDAAEVPTGTARAAFRVLQEGLTNARKHAAGQPVEVRLDGEPGSRLVIELSNPLPRNESASPLPSSGTGLVGLTERVQLAGGRLDHDRTGGQFRLHAWLPWPA